jgi:hypothetical protein
MATKEYTPTAVVLEDYDILKGTLVVQLRSSIAINKIAIVDNPENIKYKAGEIVKLKFNSLEDRWELR